MPIPESKRRNNDICNTKCDRISARPMKPVGNAIRAAAKAAGQSVQAYALQACAERMTREGQALSRRPRRMTTKTTRQPAHKTARLVVFFFQFANCFSAAHCAAWKRPRVHARSRSKNTVFPRFAFRLGSPQNPRAFPLDLPRKCPDSPPQKFPGIK